jgi:hypothetical protein
MITREQAVEIARRRAAEKGWSLAEPAHVEDVRGDFGRTVKAYRVGSNPRLRGGRSRFTIDAESGAILDEGHISR